MLRSYLFVERALSRERVAIPRVRRGIGEDRLPERAPCERDGLERGLHHLQRRYVQREAGDHRALATAPAGRALTGQEGQDREAGTVGRAGSQRALDFVVRGQLQQLATPRVDVAAFGGRA